MSRAPAHSGQGRGLGSCGHRRLLSTILSATAQNAPAPIFCLPRLNKTCPNPGKWRESLGFAGVARQTGPAAFHNADASSGINCHRRRPASRRRADGSPARSPHEEALPIPARTPPLPRAQRHGQRLPAGDGPGTGAGLRGVGDGGEQPAQLDRGRQLAALLESGADRCGLCLGDDEHRRSMGTRIMTGKRLSDDPTRPPASPVWAPQFGPLPRLPDDAVERRRRTRKLPKRGATQPPTSFRSRSSTPGR